jgi:hypothetical protein
MDYLGSSQKHNYNVSNDFWFLPTDLAKTEQDRENATKNLRKSPVISYLDEISRKDKFKYLMIIFFVALFFYHLELHWSLWIGVGVGVVCIYYMNERQAQELNTESDRLWNVLKSPLLKETKYFVSDPELIQWVNDVSEFKAYNVLEFNKMIKSLDRLLKLTSNIKVGVYNCKENLDLINDLRVTTLNQFQSLIYNINNVDLVPKFNHYLKQLGFLLNQRYAQLIKICNQYQMLKKPADIASRFDMPSINDPVANDPMHNEHYNYFN